MFDVRNMRNTATDFVDKMCSYFCYTRYHTTHITTVAATVIYNNNNNIY
jgi:hypothetical protein